MAKQEGVIKITGTIGNITFYKMNGGYYARSKSSLTGKRVKKAPNYYRFRMYSSRMACSSATAAKIYRSLRNDEREVSLYRRMVSEGLRLLRAGCAQERLEETLRAVFLPEAAQEMILLPGNAVRSGVCVDAHGKLAICAKNTAEVNGDIFKMRLYLQQIHSLISINYEIKAHVVNPAVDDFRQRVFPDQ
ncbi:hypothetical protein [Chitinophaga sp. YIM B06452]|uniref:hypothetical protein n=1 Tax=Chitinophaga sp. YIM B06452 TaxID=3082158 RepID=UPI0031FF391E